MARPAWITIALHLAMVGGPAIGSAQRSNFVPAAASSVDRLSGALTPVHDPAIIRQNDHYVVFSTSRPGEGGQLPIRTSPDLVHWTRAGWALSRLPDWARRQVPKANGLWAPDISYSHGVYRLYYAVSSFGSNRSAIGLATSPTLDPHASDYGWTDQGPVIASNVTDDFNAIDPAAFTDADGRAWLAFGSFWGGIQLVQLDPATGKRLAGDTIIRTLARRPRPGAIEAPFLVERNGYHYLFVSFDFCCRGADSSYYTVVGRSKDVTGPYVDHEGKPMLEGHGRTVLQARLDPTGRWRGPGHPAVLRDGNRFFIVYHAYDARHHGTPTLRIAQLGWTPDGWPVAVPGHVNSRTLP